MTTSTASDQTIKAVINEQMEIIGYNYFNFPITDAIFSVDDVAWTTQIPDMNGKREKAELAITFSDGSME